MTTQIEPLNPLEGEIDLHQEKLKEVWRVVEQAMEEVDAREYTPLGSVEEKIVENQAERPPARGHIQLPADDLRTILSEVWNDGASMAGGYYLGRKTRSVDDAMESVREIVNLAIPARRIDSNDQMSSAGYYNRAVSEYRTFLYELMGFNQEVDGPST